MLITIPNAENTGKQEPTKNGFDAIMDQGDKDADKNVTEEGTGSKVSQADNAVEESSEREKAMPSNILEKGIICKCLRASERSQSFVPYCSRVCAQGKRSLQ